jgi:hypothetical protein
VRDLVCILCACFSYSSINSLPTPSFSDTGPLAPVRQTGFQQARQAFTLGLGLYRDCKPLSGNSNRCIVLQDCIFNVAANPLLADSRCFRSGVCKIASFRFTNTMDRTFEASYQPKLPAKVTHLESSRQSDSLLSKVSEVASDIAPYTLKLTKAYPKDVYFCSNHLHLRLYKSLLCTTTSTRASMQSQLHKILFPRRLSDRTPCTCLPQHRM